MMQQRQDLQRQHHVAILADFYARPAAVEDALFGQPGPFGELTRFPRWTLRQRLEAGIGAPPAVILRDGR